MSKIFSKKFFKKTFFKLFFISNKPLLLVLQTVHKKKIFCIHSSFSEKIFFGIRVVPGSTAISWSDLLKVELHCKLQCGTVP